VAPAQRRQERWSASHYAKNEKENLTHAERNQLQKIASEIKQEFGG
jgi:hypothetical protein